MAIDRTKLLQNAEKLVRQGKIDQAIGVYEQLVQANPKDMSLKNKVGDLLVQAGNLEEAVKVWGQVADFYSTEGFYLKGIAVLKKVSRHAPNSVECYLKLADLYAKQGLNNEAKSQYQQVADLYAREGKPDQAAAALEELLRLDPENIKGRNRLAEYCVQAGKTAQALEEYRKIGDQLASRSMFDEALRIYEQGLALQGGHPGLVAGQVRVMLELGRCADVIETAKQAYGDNRENVEMLGVLGDAYLRTNQHELARQVFEKLLGLAPDNPVWSQRLSESKLPESKPKGKTPTRKEREEPADASVPLPDLSEMTGDYSMEELSGEWEGLGAASEVASEVEPPPSGNETEREEFIVEHMTEAEVFIKYGLVEKAIENLEAIVCHYPDETETLKRLKDLYLETGNKPRAAEKCAALARIARARGEMPQAMDLIAEARAHDPNVSLEAPTAASVAPDEVAYEFGGGMAEGPVAFDEGPPASGIELDFDTSGVMEDSGARAASGSPRSAGSSEASSLASDDEGAQYIEFNVEEGGAGPEPAGIELDFEPDSPTGEPAESDLAEADFYADQKFYPEARARLQALRERFPKSNAVKLRIERLSMLERQEQPVEAAGKAGDEGIEFFDDAIRAPRREEAGPPPEQPPAEEMDESLFEQESEFFTEAAVESPAKAAEPQRSVPVGEESLEQIFQEFKRGVDSQLDNEDYETHYNLGIAYKEMGLVDEAIAEFQLASKDPTRFLDCCSNLGLCFREKGMPKLAIKWYTKSLEKLEPSTPQYIPLLYVLGEAYEESGEREKALETFTDVYGLDANYRDVTEKLRSLEDEE